MQQLLKEVPLTHSFENNITQVLQTSGHKTENIGMDLSKRNKRIFDVKEMESYSSGNEGINEDEPKPRQQESIQKGNSKINISRSAEDEGESKHNSVSFVEDQGKGPQIEAAPVDSAAAENLSSDDDQATISQLNALANGKKIK